MIRAAMHKDAEAIRRVEAAAFGRPDEAALVARLRVDGDALLEFVAEKQGAIVGHILFSRLSIGSQAAAALAPLAVSPADQRTGIGSALVHVGIDACRAARLTAIVVLGHPSYYPRFGFCAEAAASLEAPFSGPSFMALALAPGALARGGSVRYAAAFGR